MERQFRQHERLARVASATGLALGLFAIGGCGQGSGHVSTPEINASSPPTPASILELPKCSYKDDPVSSSVVTEVNQPNVESDVANALGTTTEGLAGDSLIQVACGPSADGLAYKRINVSGLAGTYGANCVLIPVSNMAIETIQQVAECVSAT